MNVHRKDKNMHQLIIGNIGIDIRVCFFTLGNDVNIYPLFISMLDIIQHTVRAEIFAVVLFSRVKPSRKFPLQFMSIIVMTTSAKSRN